MHPRQAERFGRQECLPHQPSDPTWWGGWPSESGWLRRVDCCLPWAGRNACPTRIVLEPLSFRETKRKSAEATKEPGSERLVSSEPPGPDGSSRDPDRGRNRRTRKRLRSGLRLGSAVARSAQRPLRGRPTVAGLGEGGALGTDSPVEVCAEDFARCLRGVFARRVRSCAVL